MSKVAYKLIPHLHQEFVLVVFLMVPYAVLQLPWDFQSKLIVDNVFLLLMILWFFLVFTTNQASRQYKGFIVLVTGLSLFVAGLYASIIYYLDVVIRLPYDLLSFAYMFFPVWIMIEGVLMLFLLGFDSSSKTSSLEQKIVVTRPRLGDFVMVAIASALLVYIGEWVLVLPWYVTICLVFAVNLIIINQFRE